MKERIPWIDVARGIGIILVVYGHSLSSHSFRYLIYAFHMPLFFFLSGLVFTYRKEQSLVAFLKKNAKAILLPYVIFALISLGLWIIDKEPSQTEILKQFLSIFYGNGNNYLLAFNNILWFLPCLFLTRLGMYLINRVSLRWQVIATVLLLFSLIGYLYSLFWAEYKLFFGLETALTAIVFFGAGYLWKTSASIVQKHVEHYAFPAFFLFLLICLIFAVLNYQHYGSQVDLRVDRLNNYIYFYLSAFAGTFATLTLSQIIKKSRVLEYLGKNTLVLFAWHLLLFSYFTRFLSATGLNGLLGLLPSFLSPILYSVTAMVTILSLSEVIRRGFRLSARKQWGFAFIPFLAAKTK